MLVFDGWRQYNDLSRVARREYKPLRRCAHACERPKLDPKPPNHAAQACAMRFVGVLCTEYPPNKRIPRQISGPRLAERTREREQHRTPRERDCGVCATHDMTARVHHKRPRFQHRFNLREQEETFLATCNQ